ncbi:HAD superfamily hydrolase [Clostridium sartagoforme AAU1]|uniref:HAD superfamily hydrolase n=1 Tax=Clostridium sartagoforme AAU1 TaxID=1202534 RepID=R9BUI8_9CLOT|nr:Cof-type HAD-IIB family hydrolase [Clostridium sartagoforme]EOR20738.1 HAD superfamily hydrolase [Clostridium sartagoforme AAU1]
MKELKYKLVCIDLDGTLLTDEKTITKENIETIKKASSLGINICIATGRIYKFVDHIKEVLGNKIKVIASNGAIILKENGVLNFKTLSYEEILRLKELTKDYNVDIYLNTENEIISEKSIPDTYSYKAINNDLEDKYKVNIIENYPFENLKKDNQYKIVKAICINKDDLNEVKRVRKILEETNEFEISSAEYHYCEINSKGISKGKAVEELAKGLGVDIKEVMCIGDGGNDIEMLKRAGIAVAMKNGMENVKAIANYITEDNNNSGVAKAIKTLILEDSNI